VQRSGRLKAASRLQQVIGKNGQSNSRPSVALRRRQVPIEPEVTEGVAAQLVGKAESRKPRTIIRVGQRYGRSTGARRRASIVLEGAYDDDGDEAVQLVGKAASRKPQTISRVGQRYGRSTGVRRQVSIGLEETGDDDDDDEAAQLAGRAASRHVPVKGKVGQSYSRSTGAQHRHPIGLEGTDDDEAAQLATRAASRHVPEMDNVGQSYSRSTGAQHRHPIGLEGTDDDEAAQLATRAASRHVPEMGKVGQSYSRPTGAQQRRPVSIELEETDDEDAQLVGSQSFLETAESGLSFLSRSAAGGVNDNVREAFADSAILCNSRDALSGRSDSVGMPTLTMALGGHLPLALKEKIWKGDFVDFSNLLDSEALTAAPIPPWVVTQSGLLALQSTRQKKLDTIEQWTDAFLVFMAVFCMCHPDKAQDLLKYASVVREAAKKFSVPGALRYDEQFRKRQAVFPDRCWATIDGELWYTVLIPYGARDVRPNSGAAREIITPRAQAGTNYQRPRLFRQHGLCYAFNSKEGCRNARCRFFHACSKCRGQTHGSTDCTRLAGPEKR
jgi:hypothetical protein